MLLAALLLLATDVEHIYAWEMADDTSVSTVEPDVYTRDALGLEGGIWGLAASGDRLFVVFSCRVAGFELHVGKSPERAEGSAAREADAAD